ncbi:MAG: N-acetyltransferase [Anaerolineae bacterium]
MIVKSVDIRPMTSADIPPIVQWLVELPLMRRYGLTAERAVGQFEKALVHKDLLLAADVGEHDAACGFAWCLPQGAFGRSVYLRLIGVHQTQTGAGIGSALLEAVEESSAALSDDLVLLVSDFNHDAQRFYQRHGYQQIGSIPGYVLPDVNEFIYWKRLRRR